MKRISVCIIFLNFISSCMTLKDQGIFDMSSDQILPEHIENVYCLDVFNGVMSGEQWFSKPPEIQLLNVWMLLLLIQILTFPIQACCGLGIRKLKIVDGWELVLDGMDGQEKI